MLSPENIQDSIKGRKNAFKHIDNKWLKVTFKKQDNLTIIITAIDRSKQEEKI